MKMETIIIVIGDADGSQHLKKHQRVLDNSFESLVYITRLFLFSMIKFTGHNNKPKI